MGLRHNDEHSWATKPLQRHACIVGSMLRRNSSQELTIAFSLDVCRSVCRVACEGERGVRADVESWRQCGRWPQAWGDVHADCHAN